MNWWELSSRAVANNFFWCFSRNIGVFFSIWPKTSGPVLACCLQWHLMCALGSPGMCCFRVGTFYILMDLSLWKSKKPDYRMASAGNKYLGTGERLFCFRRIRLCLDWGFDPITAITGAPLMESMAQIGRAAAWCVALPAKTPWDCAHRGLYLSIHSWPSVTAAKTPGIFTSTFWWGQRNREIKEIEFFAVEMHLGANKTNVYQ